MNVYKNSALILSCASAIHTENNMNYDCIIYLDLDDDGDEDEEEDEDEEDSDDDVSSTVAIVSYVSVFSALLIAIAYKNRWVRD